ncbi:serine hydrolase [Sporomusa termitida]|uniref:D-aminopeptidase n=1 Tax=Sporomusa termitida TaxID=2377 RepID=A0A517E0N8_9FIRM|nr:serine hydrolase [Sporomusa termitida]QDR83167.1 D-aminopeptidase [Sporomusa termitida]
MSCSRLFKCLPVMLAGITLAAASLPALAAGPEAPPGYFALPSYQQPANPTALDKQLLAIMADYRVVGLSAAVYRDNKIIWSGGYGWADLNTGRAVTPATLFRVASLSKMVTATALMQLYEQGKFGLDDDISSSLGYQVRNPHYPAVKITFRQLLNHTSSIIDSGAYDAIVESTPALLPALDIKELLVPGGQYYSAATFAPQAPGTCFNYSNFGTGIAGSLVEKISGLPFAEYCSTFIFKPLGMDASFEPADINNWQNIATLYRPDGQFIHFRPTKDTYTGIKPAPATITAPLGSALGYSPAGGLRASTTDFAKFMQAHMNGGSYNRIRILKADTADLMHSMQWFGYSMDGFYKQKGLNFHITDDLVPGRRLIGHSGEAYGLSGDAYYDPDSRIGFVFMLNGANLNNADPFYRVENTIAITLLAAFAPPAANLSRELRAKVNANFITVNGRKIVLPAPAAITRSGKTQHLFLPAVATADALAAGINQQGDTVTFTQGQKKAVLTAGQNRMSVNGETLLLPHPPYRQNGQIFVPVRELAAALNISTRLRL